MFLWWVVLVTSDLVMVGPRRGDLDGVEVDEVLPGPETDADCLCTHDGGPGAPLAGLRAPAGARWKSKASRTRRGFPISSYIGANGHGKTLAMMHDSYLSIMQGRRILSTVRVLDPRTGETYSNYERLATLDQLVEARDCDVLLDEIVGALPSMPGQTLPVEVMLLLNQMRRRNVAMRWTAPSWMRCNVVLREVTQAVTVCRGYFPKYHHDEQTERVWGENRLFRWTTYDAFEFTEWSDNKESQLKGKANAWSWRGKKMMAQYCYDTFDAVDNVDSGEGVCFTCGGVRPKRRRPACSCGVGDVESGPTSDVVDPLPN